MDSDPRRSSIETQRPVPLPSRYLRIRRQVYDLVDGDFDSWFEWFIIILIVLNVMAFIVGSMVYKPNNHADPAVPCVAYTFSLDPTKPRKCILLSDHFKFLFDSLEVFSVVMFSLEYLLRLWTCVENEKYAQFGPIIGRLSFASNIYSLIDIAAILPFYLSSLNIIKADVSFATSIRVFRLLRLLKMEKYLLAFSLLHQVLEENSTLLIACSYYAVLMIVIFSTALYYTERYNPDIAKFYQSIPDAMFVTIIMLSGDVPLIDYTPLGKAVVAVIALVAVAFFAIPTAILGSGFVRAVEIRTAKEGVEQEEES